MSQFKSALNRNLKKTAKRFTVGQRQGQILHARLRLKCSNLKQDLVNNHLEEDPTCPNCRNVNETVEHYLLHCPLFNAIAISSRYLISLAVTCFCHLVLRFHFADRLADSSDV